MGKEGRRRRKFWLVGAFGGAVEIRWALPAAKELEVCSKRAAGCPCHSHRRKLIPRDVSGSRRNKDHTLCYFSVWALKLEKTRNRAAFSYSQGGGRKVEGPRPREGSETQASSADSVSLGNSHAAPCVATL